MGRPPSARHRRSHVAWRGLVIGILLSLGGIQLSISNSSIVLPMTQLRPTPEISARSTQSSVAVHGVYKRILGILIAITGGGIVLASLIDWGALARRDAMPKPENQEHQTEKADVAIRMPAPTREKKGYPLRKRRRRR